MIGTYCTYQSVIQLLTRKGARCAFDVSNSYQKTKTKIKTMSYDLPSYTTLRNLQKNLRNKFSLSFY